MVDRPCWIGSLRRQGQQSEGGPVAQGSSGALVVAIDGPSGSGKSTVARGAASALGLRYLDTGAMYRAATWLVLQQAVPLDDTAAVAAVASAADVQISTD